ncbi:MAG TPA: hypothetical protein VF989_13405 [Polyangiaceae bacterium]
MVRRRFRVAVLAGGLWALAAACVGESTKQAEDDGGTGGSSSMGVGGAASGSDTTASATSSATTSAQSAANTSTSSGSGGQGTPSGGESGASDGGAGQGGSATGTGGGAGSGGKAPVLKGTCSSPEDCMLADSCCECLAATTDAEIPFCDLVCVTGQCTGRQVTPDDVACIAGRCVINRSCDTRTVTCSDPPPSCAAGSAPEVIEGCFSGRCTPVAQCAGVSSCDACAEAGLECATMEAFAPSSYHCVSVPEECGTSPTCECMQICNSPFACGVGTELTCPCPACL